MHSTALNVPFFEALEAVDENSPEWRGLFAGLMVMRHVDPERGAPCTTHGELEQLYEAIERMDLTDAGRAILHDLVLTINHKRPLRETAWALDAYGRHLLESGRLVLAGCVHRAVQTWAQLTGDASLELHALLMVCHVARSLSQHEEALRLYGALGRRASELRSARYELESALGFGKIKTLQGNLPAAAEMISAVLTAARKRRVRIVTSKAMLDLGVVFYMQERYSDAIAIWARALPITREQRESDALLQNLAAAFALVGRHDAARDANLILRATTRDAGIRSVVAINLLELEYLSGRELAFETQRRAIASEARRPYLEALYHETCALGYRRFGRTGAASAAFRRVIEIAEAHGLNEMLIKAEAALKELQSGGNDKPSTSETPVPKVEGRRIAGIARRLATRREAVVAVV